MLYFFSLGLAYLLSLHLVRVKYFIHQLSLILMGRLRLGLLQQMFSLEAHCYLEQLIIFNKKCCECLNENRCGVQNLNFCLNRFAILRLHSHGLVTFDLQCCEGDDLAQVDNVSNHGLRFHNTCCCFQGVMLKLL